MSSQLIRGGLLAAVLLAAGTFITAANPADPAVKRSKAGICHELGTPGYQQIKHYKAFGSLESCLKSGGKLPKNAARKKSHFDPNKPPQPGDDGVLYGPLVDVIDGDTLLVKVQGAALHIRLAGIDAPEADQPFGDEARSELAALIGQHHCVMSYEEGDRYGRLVVHLWIGDIDVSKEMLKRGMAWFDSESAQNHYLFAYEDEARDAKRGLWALPLEERMAPWEWRKEQR